MWSKVRGYAQTSEDLQLLASAHLGSRGNNQQFGASCEPRPVWKIEMSLCQKTQHTPQNNCRLERSCKPLLSSCCRFKTFFSLSASETELQKNSVSYSHMEVGFCPERQQGGKGILKIPINTSIPFGLFKCFLSSAFNTFEMAPC